MIKGLKREDYLMMVAEECGEGAAAFAKMCRKTDGRNWTPKTEGECLDSALEEMCDIDVALDQLLENLGVKIDESAIQNMDALDRVWPMMSNKAADLSFMCSAEYFGVCGIGKLLESVIGYKSAERRTIGALSISEVELERRRSSKLARWIERQNSIPKFRGSTFEEEG